MIGKIFFTCLVFFIALYILQPEIKSMDDDTYSGFKITMAAVFALSYFSAITTALIFIWFNNL